MDVTRLKASGAPEKTGTKVFMAIGVLVGDPHSFMHDLESFFWVLFWICIHYAGPGMEVADVETFGDWNCTPIETVALLKSGLVMPDFFETKLTQHITNYCYPMLSLMKKMWTVVFPNGKRYKHEDYTLYSQMRTVLEKGRDSL